MLSVAQAEALILDLVQPLDADQNREMLSLLAAAGRILATAVTGQQDFPYWDNSAMDGYAVRHADVATCQQAPVTLTVIEEIPAGKVPQKSLQPGQAARILTGSMLPAGADTIVIQENTSRQADQVTVLVAPQAGAFVRHRADYYQAGAPLLPAGIRLAAADLAVLATAQCVGVPVYRRPLVAILSTGDELVAPDQPLQPGQIVDSNQYALAALVAEAGGEPLLLGAIPDQPEQIRQTIAHALTRADLILSSGGVSVGDYDYIDQILTDLGAQLYISAVAIKPGKPLTVASFPAGHAGRSPLYFGLPGNPASALVTFWRFVQPALRKLSGLKAPWQPAFVQGQTTQALRGDSRRETYLWGQVELVNGIYQFRLAGGVQSSGNLINLAQTNALAVLPVGQTEIGPSEPLQIMLI